MAGLPARRTRRRASLDTILASCMKKATECLHTLGACLNTASRSVHTIAWNDCAPAVLTRTCNYLSTAAAITDCPLAAGCCAFNHFKQSCVQGLCNPAELILTV
eukprot:1157784-Pelagomonas_calceolata.AAC.2